MPTATVEVKFVNFDPQKNQNFGSIKDAKGTYYSFPKEMLSDFKAGETYEIFYETKEIKGRDYHNIKASPTPSSQTNGAVSKVMEKAAYPGVATGVGDRDKNRHIFVCGCMNNALQGSGLEAFGSRDMLRAAIDNLVRAYDTSLLANPQKRDDMEDEIPM